MEALQDRVAKYEPECEAKVDRILRGLDKRIEFGREQDQVITKVRVPGHNRRLIWFTKTTAFIEFLDREEAITRLLREKI